MNARPVKLESSDPSRRAIRGAVCVQVLFVVAALACGGGARSTRDVRSLLASDETALARERAPELIAQVREAVDRAEAAEAGGDPTAAADHATRARLLLEAAQAEAARMADDEQRRDLEVRASELLERARRDEDARQTITEELARFVGARAAREEALRALELAEADEARGPRRVRLSLEEAADLRRAAAAMRARTRLIAAAARALGANDGAFAPIDAAVGESERATDPAAALDAADRAQHLALRVLGDARRTTDGPGPDGATSLAEEARQQGFEPVALPEGIAIEAEQMFAGTSANVDRRANGRIARLASIAAAHPHGSILVQVQVTQTGRAGEQLAQRRAEALRRALINAGVPDARLHAGQAIDGALAAEVPVERARLVFVAYAP